MTDSSLIRIRFNSISLRKAAGTIMMGMPLLFLPSCATPTRITITHFEEKRSAPAPLQPSYAAFWEAMENGDFEYLKDHQGSEEEKNFAAALKAVLDGDLARAEGILRDTRLGTENSLIAKRAEDLLGNILFFQSRWADLLALETNPLPREKENSGLLLARAFRSAPEESYSFPASPVVRPISLSGGGNPIVEVEVNGHRKHFWIDTGAGLSVIASDIAEECGVVPLASPKAEANTATSKKVGVQAAIANELKIGDLVICNHPIMVIDKKNLQVKWLGFISLLKIDGIIGWNAIQNLDIEINYAAKNVTIRKPEKKGNAARNFFWLGYPVVKLMTADGQPILFGLDTGARKTTITENIFKKIKSEKASLINRTSWSAGGIERIRSKVIPNQTFLLDEYAINFDKIETSAPKNALFVKLDGTIGSDLAKSARLRIDWINGLVKFRFVRSSDQ